MRTLRHIAVGAALLLGSTACADLEVTNPNAPDARRALSTAGDVESLISGAFNTWFTAGHSFNGPGPFLSNMAFQHNAPWANFGMEFYGRLPRNGIQNDVADSYYGNFTRVWYISYRSIAALADGMRALEDPDIVDELGQDAVTRAQAYGKFVQGLAHATIAVFYDRGFVVDETTDLTQQQEMLDYNALMAAALGKFDEAIALAESNTFTIPAGWMSVAVDSDQLARIAHSYKARFRASVARTPEERQAVDWNAVMADVDAGISEDWNMVFDWDNGWYFSALDYSTDTGWSQLAYWMYGMADQEGDYQRWVNTPLGNKSYEFPDGEPVLIVTPDTRFPQGSTVAEQRANQGTSFAINTAAEAGGTWKRPDRGTWRWSWYKTKPAGWDYWGEENWNQPGITYAEMRLLKAEAMYRGGNLAGAADLINVSRTAAGLNATDASGTNTSCVPKLPNEQCGNLLEMLKWEKRMETVWSGPALSGWYFDGRGWGDLFANSPLQFPVPCQELQVLQLLPCNTFGGPGGEFSAPVSTYAFPDES